MGLTANQRAFIAAWRETGDAAAAYRRAYRCDRLSDDVVARRATDLLHHPRVHAALAEPVVAEPADIDGPVEVSIETLTRELEAVRRLAMSRQHSAAAVQAVVAKARLHGLLVDRQQVQLDDIRRLSDGELVDALATLAEEAREALPAAEDDDGAQNKPTP